MDDTTMVPGLVSIAIPAYKRKWLKEAIESALAQDYPDIELIIVDDHSPQDIIEVVDPYLVNERVSYYYNEINVGKESAADNWNRCLEYARGEFFVLLCDDDVLMPGFVSTLLRLARKYPHCNVFHGRRMLFHDKTGVEEVLDHWPEYESFEEYVKAKSEVKRKHTVTEFLYRSRSIVAEKFMVFPVAYFSDDATVLRIAKDGGIASSTDPVCTIRMNEEQISSAGKYAVQKLKATLMYYDWYRTEIAPETPRYGFKDEIDNWAYRFFKETTLRNRIRILLIVPNYVWPIKQKIILFLNALRGTC